MAEGLIDEAVQVVMPGGTLAVRRGDDGNLVQSGPAQRVYRATVILDDFRTRPGLGSEIRTP